MKLTLVLTVTSLLSILLMSFHLTDDIVRGMEPGDVSTLRGVLILVVWLYGTLGLVERPSGYVIMLLGSILGVTASFSGILAARGLWELRRRQALRSRAV